ncbi:hypothetical protein [Dysgonomonas massiliensis]|uniref:hypothetical protein n=1 Tax=Dysgonomonas massiliensis TaxID=2040292 RepID=UPI000C76E654|nr:hypothetical protein [Dysgonomonas massiliensis]
MTSEELVYNSLEERAYSIKLGGKDVRMFPASLSDAQYISVLISRLSKELNKDAKVVTVEDMLSLSNSKDLASLVSVTAKSKAWFYPFRIISTWIRRKYAFHLAYNRATKLEIRLAIIHIINEMQLFFYRDCIISLQGQNILKQTKETDQTALGV